MELKLKMASQTQPEVTKLISDIFGDSDDEDDFVPTPQVAPLTVRSTADDDLFESDEEDEPARKPEVKRLQKSAFVLPKSSKKRKEGKEERKKSKEPKEKRRREEAPKQQSQKSESKLVDSSDEYDSDSDIDKHRTAEDDAFLDDEDDNADIMAEYDADNQQFHDERPDKPHKRPTTSSGGSAPKSDNPLDQTLHAMKKTKAVEISDTKKAEVAQSLLFEMDKAAKEDDLLYEQHEPAIRKLQLLPTCQRVINMKTMHNTLLDFDLLGVLRSWIEPRDKNTLPSLPIRSAVYDMLTKLPCQVDHLKRSSIGKTIMTLIHHKQETPANKIILRELVEKWSRPIFNKSSDLRASVAALQSAPVVVGPSTPRNNRSTSIEDVLNASGDRKKAAVDQSRVRLPTSNGFRFTVQPASVAVPKRKTLEEELGESKGNIMKRMKVMKGNTGKKDFRAMKADLSGRDKA